MKSKRMAAGASAMTAALLLAACGAGGPGESGGDFSGGKLVLAVLNDQSGVYQDASGPNSVKAVKMAVADYQKKYGDKAVVDKIEVTSARPPEQAGHRQHQGSGAVRRGGADVILDVPTSSAALAVATQAKNHKKLFIDVSAATTALTGAQCNKYTFQWAYNTYMLANGTGTDGHQERWQEMDDHLPRLRVRPGHDQVLHRRDHQGGGHGAGDHPDTVPERQLRDLPHQGRQHRSRRDRHDAGRAVT
jgi:hypothetical protein